MRRKRSKEEVYATDNIMSDGMNPPIAADELINAQIRARAQADRAEILPDTEEK